MKKLSVIVPVFNALDTLDELVKLVIQHSSKITSIYEIILIDDNSNDNSWNKISDLSKKNKNIIGIKLSKNYGVDIAITAGVEKSKGDYICVMSCDLQDPIEKLPEMYNRLVSDESAEILCSYYTNKHPESVLSKLFSKLYWRIFSFFIKSHYPEEEGLYRLISRKAVNFYLYNHPISVLQVKLVDNSFHARFSATKRHYLYRIYSREASLTFENYIFA